jgi:peptidoglycan glycosyltransferase
MIIAFSLVIVQLVNIQFLKAPSLNSASGNPRNLGQVFDNQRGYIFAADGSVLAKSVSSTQGPYHYMRTYPDGSLFSQIVGYSSLYLGTAGIEDEYYQYLVARAQPAQTLEQLLFSPPPKATDNVTLTVVPALQSLAQRELAGRDGAVVVINPTTGAIEAMYSNPTYDPNPLSSLDLTVEKAADYADLQKDSEGFTSFDSLAYHDSFAPGSTFKIVTTSAVYDLKPGLAGFNTPQVSSTPLPGTNLLFHNYGSETCGGTIAQMLPPSCDTGYALLGLQVGAQAMHTEAASFGFDTVPPLDLPGVNGVAASNFPTPAQLRYNSPGLAYSSIGQQDVSATALQMALVAAGVANGGVIMTPHLMEQVRTNQGSVVTSYTPTPWLKATSPQTASTVSTLMQSVVTAPNGTANKVGFPPQDHVAAKTGTAETGVTNQFTTDWMVAFAPANTARVAVAVVLPQQVPSSTGAENSGPIINAMVQAALASGG